MSMILLPGHPRHSSSSSSSSFDFKLGDKELVDTEGDKEKGQSKVDSSSSSTKTGFAMELARMMPGRYGQMRQNLGMFLVLNFMIWTGQVIFYHFDIVKNRELNYNPWRGFWISSVVWLAVAFVASVLIEGLFLYVSKHRTVNQEKDRTYDITSVTEEMAKDAEEGPPMQCEEHVGRPVPSNLLDEPRRLATSPAVFTCGPVAMTNVLRKEARKEDSFGLSRFIVYEELFEM
jgi:hypothetical protein